MTKQAILEALPDPTDEAARNIVNAAFESGRSAWEKAILELYGEQTRSQLEGLMSQDLRELGRGGTGA